MIDSVLEKKFHLDRDVEKVLSELRRGLEFLAGRVWEIEHPKTPAPDPHGHLPGSDD